MNKQLPRFVISVLMFSLVGLIILAPGDSSITSFAGRSAQGGITTTATQTQTVIASEPVAPTLTAPLRDMPVVDVASLEPVLDREVNPRFNFNVNPTPPQVSQRPQIDPLLARQAASQPSPDAGGFLTPILNFEAQGYTNVNPPDTVGDVGPNHYVQMINASGGSLVEIFDKSGNNVGGPFFLDTLGSSPCSAGLGDPIVLYDRDADRWNLSEFSSIGNRLCVYISQTADPGGAYFAYQFTAPSFPDYPKYGVWPDAYYITTNEAGGPAIYAIDRDAMLDGDPATSQRFVAPSLAGFGFQALTPADVDGALMPPAGEPGIVMRHRDDEAHNAGSNNPAEDYLDIFEVDIDWATPANSSLDQLPSIPIAEIDSELCGFFAFFCFPQQGSATTLDPLREVIMWRLQYRNFGAYETLVGNLVTDVDGTDHGGVRWFELRRSGGSWSLFQEGTYAPDAHHRWMGSAAMDGSGNIAVAYSISSSSMFPGIRYAGRLSSDTLGTLPQAEGLIKDGEGTQGSNRYGDYSAINVDPADDCTFWVTNMYGDGSSWSTQIATLKFPSCTGGSGANFSLSPDPFEQTVCEPADAFYDINVIAIGGFSGDVSLAAVGNPGTASFDVNPVTPDGSSELTIGGAPDGNYTFDVVGTSVVTSSLVQTVTLDLEVFDTAPSTPALSMPANGASGVSTSPTLSWDATFGASEYLVEVATDVGFTNLVYSDTVSGTSTSVSGLASATTHYWRVTANNVCGDTISATWNFETGAEICISPNQTIPDNSTSGLNSDLVVPDTGTLTDLNVSLDVSHGWVGDLIFTLEHVDTGTVITLFDQPGVPGSTFGCADDNIDATADDEGNVTNVETHCDGTDPWLSDSFVPEDPLADFDGEDLSGTWRLNASDVVVDFGGTLNSWCLLPAVDSSGDTFGVDISANPSALSDDPGADVVYTVNITNTGSITDTFDVDLAGNSWTTNSSMNSVNLGAGAAGSFTVTVSVPPMALAGASDSVTVTATSQANNSFDDMVSLTTTANATFGINMTADPDNLSEDPGDTVTYTVQVTSTGNYTVNFSIVSSGNNWPVSTPSDLELAPYSSASFQVAVDIPADAIGFSSDTVNVALLAPPRAGSSGGQSDNVDLTTTANAIISLAAAPYDPVSGALTAAAGATVTYTIQVTNTGNTTDTYDVICDSIWACGVAASVGPLAPGESAMVDVTHDIPIVATPGSSDIVDVDFTSQEDDSVMAAVSLETTVDSTPTAVSLADFGGDTPVSAVWLWAAASLIIAGSVWFWRRPTREMDVRT